MVARSIAWRHESAATRSELFPLAVITIIALLLPILFSVGGLYMTPSRLLYLFTVPYLTVRWLKGDFGRLMVPDYALMVFLAWMTISMGIHHPSTVITFAGSNVLLILGGYLTARGAVRSSADFIAMARLMAIASIILIPIAAYEAFANVASPALSFFDSLPGISSYKDSDYCCRLGLNRAQSVFTHPIHHGIFCSLAFAVYFLGLTNHVSFTKRFIVACLVAFSTFMSISSGAVLIVGLQAILILYGMIFYNWKWHWKAAVWGALSLYTILELATSKFAFFSLAEKLAFSSQNVWLRQVIYEVGTQQMARTPFFGFGVNRLPLPFWMTGSLDNYWLAIGVQYGLPTMAAALTLFFWPMFRVGGTRFYKGSDLYYARVSWTILMIGLTLSLATVYIWDSVQSAVYFMVGSGIFLFYANEPQDGGEVDALPRKKSPRPQYTRFPNGGRDGDMILSRDNPAYTRRQFRPAKI